MQQKILLLYNPKAGHGEHEEEELVKEIEKAGYRCEAVSTKSNGWEKIPPDIDFIVAAGGDGTVGKIILQLQELEAAHKGWPVGIIPLGTANNIANSVGSTGKLKKIIAGWSQGATVFNTATVDTGTELHRFCEGAGFGLFPRHLQDMEGTNTKNLSPVDRLEAAQKGFLHSVQHCKPAYYELEGDGYRKTGEYLMVELVNTKHLGPGLSFAPGADHTDGLLELVLFTEKERQDLYQYLSNMMYGKKARLKKEPVLLPWLSIRSDAGHFHVDEDLVEHNSSKPVTITMDARVVRVLGPERSRRANEIEGAQ